MAPFIFDNLKDELTSLKAQIRIHLRKDSFDATVRRLFAEGDILIEEIRTEIEESQDISPDSALFRQLFALQNEWAAFKKTDRRTELLSSSVINSNGYRTFTNPATENARLSEGITALKSSASRIRRMEIAARSGEDIGKMVVEELSKQCEALAQVRAVVDDGNESLNRSYRIIRQINNHAVIYKCLLIAIIVLEILILLSIVYYKFIAKCKC